MPIDPGLDKKKNNLFIYFVEYYSAITKELNTIICSQMGSAGDHYAKGDELILKGQFSYVYSNIR